MVCGKIYYYVILLNIFNSFQSNADIKEEELFNKITIDPFIYEALVEHKGRLGDLAEFMDIYNSDNYTLDKYQFPDVS